MKELKKLAVGTVVLASLVSLLFLSSESRTALDRSLRFCVETLIPSVFPFAVLGSLAGSDLVRFPHFVTSLVSKMFKIDEGYSKVIILGMIFGFPTGISGARALPVISEKNIRDYRFTSVITCAPGIAFTVLGVGKGLLGSTFTGQLIYVSNLLSVIIVGIILSRIEISKDDPWLSKTISDEDKSKKGIADVLCNSVAKTGGAMLTMCAFVIFFSQISLLLSTLGEHLSFPYEVSLIIDLLLEAGGGTYQASRLGGTLGTVLSCFAISWGGISMQLQTLSLSFEKKVCLRYGYLAVVRFITALISSLICFVFVLACTYFKICSFL